MRVLFDVNVYISAFISSSPDAPPVRVLQAIRDGVFTICVSRELLEELEDVLKRPKMKKLLNSSEEDVSTFVRDLRSLLTDLTPLPEIPAISRDQKDDYLLATALHHQADLIVTGDQDLLILRHYQKIPIITPRQFIDALTGPE